MVKYSVIIRVEKENTINPLFPRNTMASEVKKSVAWTEINY